MGHQGRGRSSGPKTAAGKAISSRNATTHGFVCRQTVLPHLGEDPQAYLGERRRLVTAHGVVFTEDTIRIRA